MYMRQVSTHVGDVCSKCRVRCTYLVLTFFSMYNSEKARPIILNFTDVAPLNVRLCQFHSCTWGMAQNTAVGNFMTRVYELAGAFRQRYGGDCTVHVRSHFLPYLPLVIMNFRPARSPARC